ncbi:MAG: class I SAM-dependent methyltransferase [Alphaproteobacteria bacterium]|nr:class I SAM-dependent methyltransferase [Alphaproteobacteria bacterium]
MHCRFCDTQLSHVFADLDLAPPSNSYLRPTDLNAPEVFYPLKIWTCESCFLTQIDEFKSHDEIFSEDYAYFSSFSSSWVAHAKRFVGDMAAEFGLNEDSRIVEVASNDGYLLQHAKAMGIPCLGVEPTASTAKAAREKGIETCELFFGKATAKQLADEGWHADLTAANNVLAHVPDINDFLGGFKILLKEKGVASFEFPHLLQLVQNNQFDTIYHEHFSYLSLLTVQKIAEAQGLEVFHVQEIPTHGGSLRVLMSHKGAHAVRSSVAEVLGKERAAGMDSLAFYDGFQKAVDKVRLEFLEFLISAKKAGKTIAGYGAAAKGNTLLNYSGVKTGFVDYVCDLSPHKQGLLLPGSHIPVVSPDKLAETKPDYIVIFPWNLREEVTKQLAYAREWGAKFVVAIPKLEVF